MQRSGFNNARVRQANKQIFLSHLWREKQLSKSQLAQLTGLSIPAVSNILEEPSKRCRWFNALAAFWPPTSSPRLMCRDSITRQWMAMRCD